MDLMKMVWLKGGSWREDVEVCMVSIGEASIDGCM